MGTLVNQNGDFYATSFPGSSTSRPLKREWGQEGKDPGKEVGLNATWPVKVSPLLSNWKPLQTKSNSNLPGNRLWIINAISTFAYKPKNIWGYFVTLIWPSRNAPKNVHRSKSTNLTLIEVACIQLHAFLEISKRKKHENKPTWRVSNIFFFGFSCSSGAEWQKDDPLHQQTFVPMSH